MIEACSILYFYWAKFFQFSLVYLSMKYEGCVRNGMTEVKQTLGSLCGKQWDWEGTSSELTALSEADSARMKEIFVLSCHLLLYLWILSHITNTFSARPNFPRVPSPGRTFAEVSAGYLLWCRCTAELHELNDEYTCQWHLTMHINWRDNSSVAVNVLRVC